MISQHSVEVGGVSFDKGRLVAICAGILTVAGAAWMGHAYGPTPESTSFAENKAAVVQAVRGKRALLVDCEACAQKASNNEELLDCLDAEYSGRRSIAKDIAPLESRPEADAELAKSFL
jgi:hypothetical protein